MNVIAKTTEIKIDAQPNRRNSAKPVYCITDGKIYASVTDAAIAENVHVTAVSMTCRGKQKTTNGKQFCFIRDLKNHILDIANNTLGLKADAEKYRAIEAERKAKEEHEAKMKKTQLEIKQIEDTIERLTAEKAEKLVEYVRLTKQAV